ncbi:MAG TPA: ATP-binding protein, partial [Candidatus Portnoybacteria bacterium]|nr:ATP-binding protein [Candidatus Portnoybacteria bacterium]
MIKKYIKREKYLKKIKPFINQGIIKVLVGQRRVGKSYLLFQIMDLIKSENPKANIIYINKEQFKFDAIRDYQTLLEYIKKHSLKSGKNYVFIDEIQDIDQFEKALRSLNANGNYDLYCTGSNANLLSGELATYLSGRYIEILVHSLDYREFLKFHKLKDSEKSFKQYIIFGGLPYLKHLELDEEIVFDYLQSIYNTILLKDVINRYKIRNISFLKNLSHYVADNVGALVSAKKISDFLISQKIKISPNTVLDYLSYLSNAFLIYKVPRIDIKGRKIFEINEKYYFEDLGLRNVIAGYNQDDINKILENLVYLHLISQGYEVFVGQLDKNEIDFVAEKKNERV